MAENKWIWKIWNEFRKDWKKFSPFFFHASIVSLLTFISWLMAESGQNFLPSPWNMIFFFSRFFLDINIIVFTVTFLIYFKYINYFKAQTVVFMVAANFIIFDTIIWFMFKNGEWFFHVLNWIISTFVVAIIIMVMSMRYEKKKS